MTSALVIYSHYLENSLKYDVVEKKRVLFRFVGTAYVVGFRFSLVLVEVYLKMRFGTSRNAVMQLPNRNKYILTEGFPCFFLSCKADAGVTTAKMGHGPHSS
jgi:hypothetical protein